MAVVVISEEDWKVEKAKGERTGSVSSHLSACGRFQRTRKGSRRLAGTKGSAAAPELASSPRLTMRHILKLVAGVGVLVRVKKERLRKKNEPRQQ